MTKTQSAGGIDPSADFLLFFAIQPDRFCGECCGAVSAPRVDIGAEAFVFRVHLAKPGENFFRAGIKIPGDAVLQLFHERLRFVRIR